MPQRKSKGKGTAPGQSPDPARHCRYRGRSGLQGLQTALAPLSLAQRTLRATGASFAQGLQRIPPCTSHLAIYMNMAWRRLSVHCNRPQRGHHRGFPAAKQFLAERVAVHLGCHMNPATINAPSSSRFGDFNIQRFVDNLPITGISSTIDSTSHSFVDNRRSIN